jgi:hypothetical protein
MTSTHVPTEEKDEAAKEEFYAVPNYNIKKQYWGTSMLELEKEYSLYATCGGHSLHNKTNYNGKRMTNLDWEEI